MTAQVSSHTRTVPEPPQSTCPPNAYAVTYDTLLRRAELTSLQVSDLLERMGGDVTLLVRRSKTDYE